MRIFYQIHRFMNRYGLFPTYVKPEKIVLYDGLRGRTDAGMSMEEALKAMPKPLADIVRNPVPN